MKRFIIKSIVFLSIVPVLIYGLTCIPQRNVANDYFAGMVQKHQRSNSIDSPKIILAAGSNMAFGVNSELIEKEFSLPVVNLSIHAGLGANFILEELKSTMKSKDIVFLSLEYLLDDGDNRLKERASKQFPTASNFYKLTKYGSLILTLENTKERIKNELRFLISPGLRQMTNDIYNKNAFNKYGDVISHLDKRSKKRLKGKGMLKYKYWDIIDKLNEFNKSAENKGVNVFYFFPTYPETVYEKNKDVIKLLEKDLKSDMKIEILNTPSSFVYPDSFYFDTVYHLGKTGTEKRTLKMIELVKQSAAARQVIGRNK